MMFELQAKNYEKVHKEISDSDSSKMNDELWFARAISAIGLSQPDADKLKEAVMCLEKVSKVTTELVTELDTALNDLKVRYSTSFWAAYDGQMRKDKPDDVNYGLQMVGGELQKNLYIMGKGEALENVCKIYEILHPLIIDDKELLKSSISTFKHFLSIGFRKNFKPEQINWQKPITMYDGSIKKLDPSHVPSRTHVEGNCFIATAVYGSYDHPSVLVFRDFRDGVLAKNLFGRLFIKTYYKYGKYPANVVKYNEFMSNCLKTYFFEPIKKSLSKIK